VTDDEMGFCRELIVVVTLHTLLYIFKAEDGDG
jgi:hypothetical protein